MESGTPVYDVDDRCEMQQTAEFEEGFTDSGFFIVLFSPGDIEGHWGWTTHHPVHRQWENWIMTDHCSDPNNQDQWIPSAYVKHRPLNSLNYMKYLAAHEMGHVWRMDHEFGECDDGWFQHEHRTIATFTSGATPSACDSNWLSDNHYHWDYTTTNEDRMWHERQKVTKCHNSPDDLCTDEAYPGDDGYTPHDP